MGLMMLGIHTAGAISAWVECLWGWDKYWRGNKTQITRYWSNPSSTEWNRGVGQFFLRSINLLILFEIRRNCLRSGRSRSLYLFIRRVVKQIAVII